MTATRKAAQADEPQEPINSDIEILYEDVEKAFKDGTKKTMRQPYGKRVPVVLIVAPKAFKIEHEKTLRADLKDVCKRHDRDGETYFEVGESDDMIEAAIKTAIASLQGVGIQAKRAIRFTPYLSRREW